jgi:hypothetical protein
VFNFNLRRYMEDLTVREGAAVKRGLALSADLEEVRGVLAAEIEAHAASTAAREVGWCSLTLSIPR